ncbi:MAG: glycosyltransferase family 2 protein [Algicola sp.]|nr:glycosyltransferase family 2 protein [Algicola sp.]
MTLSVVIPVYNGAEFIQKSYNSIIDQNVDDFEILYVDNNSTDDSVKHIETYVAKDERVKLYIQKKQGAAPARNLGITKAKGDYIYVFDVDDEIYPNALNTMINVLVQNERLDAVFGRMVKSDVGIDKTEQPEDTTGKVILKEKPYWGHLWFSSLKTVVGPPGFLYRKRVFSKIGMYNEAIKNNEDTALDIKLGMTCDIAFLDMYVYLYFKHPDSTIEQSKRKMPRAFMIWPRLIHEHVPFHLEHQHDETFKKLLFSQLFQAMGKQLYYTKPYRKRRALRNELIAELQGIKLPLVIRCYLNILTVLPYSYVIKFYGYYLVPYIVKKI